MIKNSIAKKMVAIASIASLIPMMSFGATKTVTMTASTLGHTEGASSVTMDGLTVSTADQTSTGELTGNTVTDNRGSLAGWSVTATMTHFKKDIGAIDATGTDYTNSKVTFSGAPNCTIAPAGSNGAGSHTLTIDTGGASPAWTMRTADGTSTGGTGNSVDFGDGLTATLSLPTTGAVVRYRYGCIFYTNDTVTPSALTSVSGSTYGIAVQAAAALSGTEATSAAYTAVIADEGTGNGSYTYTLSESVTVSKNSAAGAHPATLTLSVS